MKIFKFIPAIYPAIFMVILISGCKEDPASATPEVRINTLMSAGGNAKKIPVFRDCPQEINSTSLNTPVVNDFTEHTYNVDSDDLDFIAGCEITRTFARPIKRLKLTIVGGHADDVGYVGNKLVTPDNIGCFLGGSVRPPVDVTNQVQIAGNVATLQLRAKETCCGCVSGWGEENLPGSANARFHWIVNF